MKKQIVDTRGARETKFFADYQKDMLPEEEQEFEAHRAAAKAADVERDRRQAARATLLDRLIDLLAAKGVISKDDLKI